MASVRQRSGLWRTTREVPPPARKIISPLLLPSSSAGCGFQRASQPTTPLEDFQCQAQLRRLGRDLHEHAAATSPETVDALAAVVSRLASATDYGQSVQEGFGEAMLADAESRHLTAGQIAHQLAIHL